MLEQCIFFDLGWTLEDETRAQIDRARNAAVAVSRFGVVTTAEFILELQEQGAAQQAPSVFRYALSQLGLGERQTEAVLGETSWDKRLLFLYPQARTVLRAMTTEFGWIRE